MVKISQRVQQIMPSGTLAMAQKARLLMQNGKEVINLSLGEPDFNTPMPILQAAVEAIEKQKADHYTPTSGIAPLKQKISEYHLRKDHVHYAENEIAVFTGAKFALYTAFQTLLDPDDEVLVPIPYWVSYSEQIKLAEGKAIFIPTDFKEDFKVTPEILSNYYTNRTKLLLLTSPSNPTGTTYTKEELTQIAKWAIEHEVFIVSDEIYYELVYNNKESISIATLSEEVKKNVLIVNGLSKSCAMTGWRFGYVLGSKDIIRAMVNLTTHTTSNVTVATQYAALAALDESLDAEKVEMKEMFEKRLNHFYPLVNEIPGFECHKPGGAFYFFVKIEEAMKLTGFSTSEEFCFAMLEDAGIGAVAGENFGLPGYMRVSCVVNEDTLSLAAKRMKDFVNQHSK